MHSCLFITYTGKFVLNLTHISNGPFKVLI